jgi:hypothetical protein
MTVQMIIDKLLTLSNEHLIPVMCVAFVLGIWAKFSLWFLKKSQVVLAKQIEKKIYMFLIEKDKVSPEIESAKNDYFSLINKLMNLAHDELYEMKVQKMRRKLDYVTTVTDRAFLLIEGSRRLIKDVSMQVRYYDQNHDQPDFEQITNYAERTNPAYNRLFGLFGNHSLNSILHLLPGLFVIGGIFGTFVGIMQGLPELTNMDLSDPVMTKKTMDSFLNNIAYSMNTSLVGIVLCVAMNIFNSLFDSDSMEEEFSEKLKSCLVLAWREVLVHRKGRHQNRLSLIPETPPQWASEIDEAEGDEPPPLKAIG